MAQQRQPLRAAPNTPTLFTDMVAVSATQAPHPAPAVADADDPERPASIAPKVWGMLQHYAHLIAVEEPQLRCMLADAQGDPQVAAALERKGREIDELRREIVAAAGL